MDTISILPVISMAQGSYFLFTGILPLICYRTFQKVTGPKEEGGAG
jgi:hypothetical protein